MSTIIFAVIVFGVVAMIIHDNAQHQKMLERQAENLEKTRAKREAERIAKQREAQVNLALGKKQAEAAAKYVPGQVFPESETKSAETKE